MSVDLDALLDRAAKKAAKQYARNGQLVAFWLAVKPDGKREVLDPPGWENDAQKVATFAVVRHLLRQMGAVAYCHAAEVWVLKRAVSEAEYAEIQRKGIAENPERQECIHYYAEDDQGNFRARFQMIERPKDRPSYLKDEFEPFPADMHQVGRMAGWLSNRPQKGPFDRSAP